jgi:hypothetical protein
MAPCYLPWRMLHPGVPASHSGGKGNGPDTIHLPPQVVTSWFSLTAQT